MPTDFRETPMDAREPVVVHTVTSAAEAEIIRNMLRAEGVACEVGGENQAGLAGVLEIEILVRAEDAGRASKFIKEHQKSK